MIETTNILLGSVLKPVDDTRMYEKLGKSLSKNDSYKVSIFGLKSSQNIKDNKIDFYPQSTFSRISLTRLKSRYKFFKTCLKVKPDIIIVNTHELLGVMCLYRILFGCKAIYDVQENYFLNLLYGNAYIWAVKPFLSAWVRLKEITSSLFIHHFLLAERSYQKELPFIGNRYTILENKFVFPKGLTISTKALPDKEYKIIYTGTISKLYGVFDAIEFFLLFQKHFPGSQLNIIGFSPLKKDLNRLKSIISDNKSISLIGGDRLVPHSEILNQIQHSDLAIVSYEMNRSIIDCFPTKIWEYMALNTPFFIKNELPWVPYCKENESCIEVNLRSPDWEDIHNKLKNSSFYALPSNASFLWSEQENALFSAISNII